jgi:hypothetical protein
LAGLETKNARCRRRVDQSSIGPSLNARFKLATLIRRAPLYIPDYEFLN